MPAGALRLAPVRSRAAAAVLIAGLVVAADGEAAQKKATGRSPGCAPNFETVCARTSLGVLANYGSACFAQADRAVVIARRPCASIECPPAELPVCGRKGGASRVYPNRCVAEREGAMVIAADTCPSACVPEDRRVCAVDETGKRREFRNACEAAVGGARVLHPGRCVYQRVCAVEGVRVCAIDVRTGKEVTYANLCEAEAANADYRHRGKCGARWRTLLKRLNPDGQR